MARYFPFLVAAVHVSMLLAVKCINFVSLPGPSHQMRHWEIQPA